jgi:hypothetical protein
MSKYSKISKLFLTSVLILLTLSSGSVSASDAYGGYISDNRVEQGEVVNFSGTFHNAQSSTMYVISFNVSFVEQLGQTAQRDPRRDNISRVYDESRRVVATNSSITDTLTEAVTFEPGKYNVSIFFMFSSDSSISPVSTLNSSYALINSSFVIEGATQALEIARFVSYIIGAITVFVVGLLVYNAKFKK